MIIVTTTGNKVEIDLSNLPPMGWIDAIKMSYRKDSIIKVELTSSGFVVVRIIGEEESWKITDLATYGTFTSTVKQESVLPISSIDGVDITSLDQLYSIISPWQE